MDFPCSSNFYAGGLPFYYKIEGLARIACIGKFRLLVSVETLVEIKMGKTLGKDENAFTHPLLGKDENAFTKPFTESIHFPLQ
jgi:hypothetical protein